MLVYTQECDHSTYKKLSPLWKAGLPNRVVNIQRSSFGGCCLMRKYLLNYHQPATSLSQSSSSYIKATTNNLQKWFDAGKMVEDGKDFYSSCVYFSHKPTKCCCYEFEAWYSNIKSMWLWMKWTHSRLFSWFDNKSIVFILQVQNYTRSIIIKRKECF